MIVKEPSPEEILKYTEQKKIRWFQLNNENFWWSSNTKYWAFTLDTKELTYFRLSTEREKYTVKKKLDTMKDAKYLYLFLKNS